MIKQQMRRVRLAVVALGLIGVAPSVFAAGGDTNFSTPITNTASVNYSVSGVPQTVINSSPTGNSTPGAGSGAPTSFMVDKRHHVHRRRNQRCGDRDQPRPDPRRDGVPRHQHQQRCAGLPPCGGQHRSRRRSSSAVPTRSTCRTSRMHISAAACSTATMATPTYAAETATTFIAALAEDACRVRVRALGYAGVTDGRQRPRVDDPPGRASATTTGSSGATLEAANGRCGQPRGRRCGVRRNRHHQRQRGQRTASAWRYDQYFVGTLTVTKTAAVISDGFSAAGQAKAIPGAIVEYTISVQNNGLVTSGASTDGTHPGQHDLRRGLDHAQRRGTSLTWRARCPSSPAVRSTPRRPPRV